MKLLTLKDSPKELELAKRYGFELIHNEEVPCLKVEDGRLVLFQGDTKEKPVSFPLNQLLMKFQKEKVNAKNPMLKAIGHKGNLSLKILDLTVGTAQDYIYFFSLGHELYGYERHPVVAALVEDALKDIETHNRLHFNFGNGVIEEKDLRQYDVVYYDPMYPQTDKKKSLPRKEMRIFKSLVGPDEDADDCIENLLTKGPKRLVIKRPSKAPVYGRPQAQYIGKSIRFDVYINASK